MKKRTVSLLLALCMVLQLCSSMAFATGLGSDITFPISGKCGMNLTWTLTANGTMTISGSGTMFDYSFDEDNEEIPYKETPWLELSEDIRKIVIEEGVTSIGSYAFSYLDNLTSVEVAATVTAIGERAFDECYQISEINFKGDAPAIHEYAFNYAGYDDGTIAYYPAGNDTWTEAVRQNYGGTLTWLALPMDNIEDGGEDNISGDIGMEGEGSATEPEQPEISDNTCGDNLTWTLEDGVLTISGSGDMVDYHWQDNPTPWDLTAVQQVVFAEDCAITSIGSQAFMQCGQLEEIDIPDSVKVIEDMAFYGCEKLASVHLSEGLETIGTEAFCMCPITEVTLPEGLTSIGSMAFAYGGLTEITVQTQAEPTLGDRVFAGLTLTTYANWPSWSSDQWGTVLPIPGTEEPEQPEVFEGLTWSVSDDGTILTIGGTGPMPDYEYIEIDYVGQYTTPWYENAANITEVVIGDGITRIGANAFGEMWSLAEITIGASVAELAEGVFQSCYGLGEIALSTDNPHLSLRGGVLFNAEQTELLFYPSSLETAAYAIPTTVEKIAPYAFYCASYNLTTVGFPIGLTEIGDHAFYYKSLTSITLPDTVTTIGDYAFYGNSADRLVIPDSVTSIGEYAFGSIFGLTDVQIGSGLKEMGECAFSDCSDLATITVAAGNSAFCAEGNVLFTKSKDTLLLYPITKADTSYTVPDTVRTIATRAFYSNSGLTEVILPDGLETIGEDAFFNIRNLAKADLPATVTVIGRYAFGNTALTAVTIPDGVDTIGASAFAYAPVTTVILGKGVTEIEERAFSGCTKLTEITFTGEIPAFGLYAFSSVKATAYYPDNALWNSLIESLKNASDLQMTWVPYAVEEPDTTAPVITDVWPATEGKVTLCHDGTLQVAATDETALGYAEFYAGDGLIGSANFNASGIASMAWNCAELSGAVTLTYKVYDKAGNSAEQTEVVTVRPYEAPKTPENLTVENGFRSGTLRWGYNGDLQTLKQFNIYDGDPEGGMLVTTVKGYSYTFRNLEEPCSYKVAAVDIYGNQSFSTEAVTITPVLTENVAPKAVMQLKSLTGLTGKAINFSAAGSTDNDAIAAYAWNFGDGVTGEGLNCAHTYASAGTYIVTLTVTDRSGNRDTAQAEVTILDTISENATHAVLTITVQDGYTAGTPAIPNATVTVYNDSFELAALTNAYGCAELVVPKGSYTMTVVASGYDGKAQQIEVNETGGSTVYLAKNGVSVVDGDLTVKPMTREEMEEIGIDTNDPANSHVVKQQTTIRFQPMPEVAFDIPIEQIVDALGNLIPDKSKGFGWHTFTPDPPEPDDPEEDDEGGSVIIDPNPIPVPPKYDVGVFPVGDSAYMVIYGQTHWLKEMFNVELIVYNNSYAQDIEDCVAELNLPEGLSLAAMLEGEQSEQVSIGQIDYIGKTDAAGTAIGLPTRQVNWYVRGDKEGDYNLTAAVSGMVGGDPFQTTFTTDESIHVYAGSALLLTVTMPKSAYADQEYVVKFSLNNVSDKPIYNLTFGIDTAQQFVAERMSDGSTGEVEREYSNEDFEGGMTYGLPTLEPGKAFNLIIKTTFEYEHQFIEWAVGKVPLGIAEVGYQVADCFVTTLEGSTTEIPVEIILEDVKKDDLFQWIWDETIGAFKDGIKDKVIEFVDDEILQGVPVVEKSVAFFEVVTGIKDEITEEDAQYIPTVNVTEGVQCVPKNEVDHWLSAFDTYSLRGSAAPGVLVWTDAADAVISEDGRSMTMPSGGKLYTLRLGETAVTPAIDITTYYMDADGSVQPFTRTLTTEETYTAGLQNAKHILLEQLAENTFEIPAEGETLEVSFDGWLIGENDEILLRAANEKWSIAGENTDGLTVVDGTLVIGSEAKAGTYTVQLALEGTDKTFEQTIILTSGCRLGDVDGSGGVNVGDATYLLKFLAGLLPEVTLDPAIADMDGNGVVDVGDATYLMKMLAGLLPEMQ